ncbi:MAG: YhbY family RNA-binding protein [Ezakiella sp.]|nr:YhbY family RNA-binding protein [Ezakiella sp.]MDD7471402.1 YhbY family RNA-binding protein [Bacillota bacterium]MDY3922899.1 YhbY family RNA-binding protein [Ezakiella sp.]
MINSKERAFLKSKLNTLKPALRVGKDGIKDETLKSIDLYLNKNEIMKIQILNNSDVEPMELFEELEQELGVDFLARMGNNLSIYRKSDKNILLKEMK